MGILAGRSYPSRGVRASLEAPRSLTAADMPALDCPPN